MTTIYLRQSEDKTGEGAAVERQLAECRTFCESKGWAVESVLQDNDTSATTGVTRPAFDSLLASQPERIVVWHIDRLVRVTRDLERVIELGVNVHAVKSGHIDLSTPAGRAVARTVTAWATYEGEQKATRQVAANRQRAQKGIVRWTRRPFGFDRDGDKVRTVRDEAKEIRAAAKKVLAGATLASIADDLNAREVPTSVAGKWSVTAVRRILMNPRNVGRVVYKGEDLGSINVRILDDDTYARVVARLTDPRRKTAPTSTRVRYLLSGIVLCGRDGCDNEVMFATANAQKRAIYRCLKCYGGRGMEDVDEVVVAHVVARLSRPDAKKLLASHVDLDALRDEAVELRERRDSIAALVAEGLLGRDAAREQAKGLVDKLNKIERKIESVAGDDPVAEVVGSLDPQATFDGLSLARKRRLIRAVVTARILPVGKGIRFDPEHVDVKWKADQ